MKTKDNVGFAYKSEIEIVRSYAKLHPNNCAVREYTADGEPVGPCSFYLIDGTHCPRHGLVKVPVYTQQP